MPNNSLRGTLDADALLTWYNQNKRSLPWRGVSDPYQIWLSEIMLQQTQVATVVPYYQRFLAQFPTIESLAAAPEQALLKVWEGLGYYSRARNLQAAARTVVEAYGGRLPSSLADLLRLPGVGPYTAGAIASIAFGQAVPAVDGNVLRVAARIFGIDAPIDQPATRRLVEAAIAPLIPAEAPGDFNQALMELGALVCLPSAPQCQACPVADGCFARRAGQTRDLPKRRKRMAQRQEVWVAVAILHDNHCLMGRRREGALLGGLWELPCALWPQPIQPGGGAGGGQGGEATQALAETLVAEVLTAVGPPTPGTAKAQPVGPCIPLGELEHVFTHLRWRVHGFVCQLETQANRSLLAAGALSDPEQPLPLWTVEALQWVPLTALSDYPVATVHRRLLERLRRHVA